MRSAMIRRACPPRWHRYGMTALHDALLVATNDLLPARRGGGPPETREAMLVLSDGEDTASLMGFEQVLPVRRRGSSVYAVSLRADARGGMARRDWPPLALAPDTGGRALGVAHLDALPDLSKSTPGFGTCIGSATCRTTKAVTGSRTTCNLDGQPTHMHNVIVAGDRLLGRIDEREKGHRAAHARSDRTGGLIARGDGHAERESIGKIDLLGRVPKLRRGIPGGLATSEGLFEHRAGRVSACPFVTLSELQFGDAARPREPNVTERRVGLIASTVRLAPAPPESLRNRASHVRHEVSSAVRLPRDGDRSTGRPYERADAPAGRSGARVRRWPRARDLR
jgi:hypothetical protein